MTINNSQSTNERTPELSTDEVVDLLADDKTGDDETQEEEKIIPDGETEDNPEDDVEEEDKDDEDELELEEGNKEQELMTPARKKVILKKYPNLFKDFPHLEVSNFRDQQFTELFGTVDNAKEIKEKADAFEKFETALSEGKTTDILKEVRDNDPDSFGRIVDNYLQDLHAVDQSAYFAVIGNVIKQAVSGALTTAKENEDEELQEIASKFFRFIFGQKEELKLHKFAKPRDTTVDKERQDWIKEKFETSERELEEKTDNTIRATIEKNIDPNNKMLPYVKKNAIRDAMETLKSTIADDKTFKKTVLDPLWKKAHDDKFSRASLDSIKSAYLSRAKSLLKSIIFKARNEALKGSGQRKEKDRSGPITPGRNSTSSNSRGRKEVTIPKGMRTLDFLNSD